MQTLPANPSSKSLRPVAIETCNNHKQKFIRPVCGFGQSRHRTSTRNQGLNLAVCLFTWSCFRKNLPVANPCICVYARSIVFGYIPEQIALVVRRALEDLQPHTNRRIVRVETLLAITPRPFRPELVRAAFPSATEIWPALGRWTRIRSLLKIHKIAPRKNSERQVSNMKNSLIGFPSWIFE